MAEVKLKIKTEVECRIYRNEKLKEAIARAFETEDGQKAAWLTIALIKELYPGLSETLNGELVSIDTFRGD